MVERQIKWSNQSKLELAHILEFYLNRNGSGEYSRKLVHRFDQAINLLASTPFLGIQNKDDDSRVLVLGSFSIIYEFDETHFFILSIWDDRQDPQKKLKKKS
jgi:plasmid stabilization system protein ParE